MKPSHFVLAESFIAQSLYFSMFDLAMQAAVSAELTHGAGMRSVG
jgi:hypothetical protein